MMSTSPAAEDKQWAADRVTILEALGVLDPEDKPTALVDTVKAADVARLTQEDWQRERDKMVATCNQCHSGIFARLQLQLGDEMEKNADHLVAEAIRIVARLCKDGEPCPSRRTMQRDLTEIRELADTTRRSRGAASRAGPN